MATNAIKELCFAARAIPVDEDIRTRDELVRAGVINLNDSVEIGRARRQKGVPR